MISTFVGGRLSPSHLLATHDPDGWVAVQHDRIRVRELALRGGKLVDTGAAEDLSRGGLAARLGNAPVVKHGMPGCIVGGAVNTFWIDFAADGPVLTEEQVAAAIAKASPPGMDDSPAYLITESLVTWSIGWRSAWPGAVASVSLPLGAKVLGVDDRGPTGMARIIVWQQMGRPAETRRFFAAGTDMPTPAPNEARHLCTADGWSLFELVGGGK